MINKEKEREREKRKKEKTVRHRKSNIEQSLEHPEQNWTISNVHRCTKRGIRPEKKHENAAVKLKDKAEKRERETGRVNMAKGGPLTGSAKGSVSSVKCRLHSTAPGGATKKVCQVKMELSSQKCTALSDTLLA